MVYVSQSFLAWMLLTLPFLNVFCNGKQSRRQTWVACQTGHQASWKTFRDFVTIIWELKLDTVNSLYSEHDLQKPFVRYMERFIIKRDTILGWSRWILDGRSCVICETSGVICSVYSFLLSNTICFWEVPFRREKLANPVAKKFPLQKCKLHLFWANFWRKVWQSRDKKFTIWRDKISSCSLYGEWFM